MKPTEMTDEELVNAVAQEVMGWELCKNDNGEYWFSCKPIPKMSYGVMTKRYELDWNSITNANHRDMVVEQMAKKGYWLRLRNDPYNFTEQFWCADFVNENKRVGSGSYSLGRAVCEAALMAVRNEAI